MERLHFITNICHKKAPMQKVRSFLHNLHRFWHPDTVFGDSFQHDRSISACSRALPPSPVSYIIAKGESHNQDSPFPVEKKRKSGQRIRTARRSDRKLLFRSCSRAAPVPQTRTAHVNTPDEQHEAQEDCAHITPRVLVHGKDERRADAPARS